MGTCYGCGIELPLVCWECDGQTVDLRAQLAEVRAVAESLALDVGSLSGSMESDRYSIVLVQAALDRALKRVREPGYSERSILRWCATAPGDEL